VSVSRALLTGAAALAAIGVVAACSTGGQSGTGPSSGAPASTSAGSSSGNSGAPHVPVPLKNVDRIASTPCDSLSSDQIDKLGMVGPGRQTQLALGPTCQWVSVANATNTMNISVITDDRGLGNVYGKKSEHAYFEPTTIEGYPAVYASQIDDRSTGTCALWVGVTDQRMVHLETQLSAGPNRSNPCPVVERTAKAMIEHLKSAA
jgi:hypothetical protein